METEGLTTAMPYRRWIFFSLVCAAVSLSIAPLVFGPLGVIAGIVAVWKGAKWRGTVGISASVLAAGIGL